MKVYTNSSKLLFILILFILYNNVSYSQFSFEGEFRPRLELRHGYKTLASDTSGTAIFVSQRSRLKFNYENEKYSVGLSVQDVRVWGDENQLKDEPSISLHEAWGEINLCDHLALKLGRQELAYDDQRLIGSVNWVQQARSHDAAVFKFKDNGWKVDFIAAYSNEKEELFKTKFTANNYRALSFLWLNKTVNDNFKFSIISIADGYQSYDTATTSDKILFRYTVGPYIQVKTGDLKLFGTFYYQIGKDRNFKDISAYLGSFKGSYHKDVVDFGVGIDYLSGTDALDSTNKKNNTFNTLYATNHKFYGFMDYFLNLPVNTNNGGLIDIYASIKYQASKRIALLVNYHNFRLADNVLDPTNSSVAIDKELGSEIDAVLNFNILPEVNLKLGYSVMLPTSSMEVLKGGDKDAYQDWGWIMINFKPIFFNSDW